LRGLLRPSDHDRTFMHEHPPRLAAPRAGRTRTTPWPAHRGGCRRRGLSPVTVKVRPHVWSNNGDTCVAACVRGAGIQLQPTFLIASELASGQLVEVLAQYRSIELCIYAVHPTRKFVMPKVRARVEFLSAKLADAQWALLWIQSPCTVGRCAPDKLTTLLPRSKLSHGWRSRQRL
jgi:DNA-binding transcriptional LysR family regulator